MEQYFASPLGVASYSLFRPEHSILANKIRGFLARRLATDSYIIDIGCGPGTFIELWLSLAPAGTIIGIDTSVWAIEVCKNRFANVGNVKFLVADIRNPPFSHNTFTFTILSQIFLPDFLNSCVVPAASLLLNDGRLLIVRPYTLNDSLAEWFLRVEQQVSELLGFLSIDEESYWRFAKKRSDIRQIAFELCSLGFVCEDIVKFNLRITYSSYEEFMLGMVDSTLFPKWRIVGSNMLIPDNIQALYAYHFFRIGREEYDRMGLQYAPRSYGVVLARKNV